MAKISTQLLQETFDVIPSQAESARMLLQGKAQPEEVSQRCRDWVRACYNEPNNNEKIMCALDELLMTFGVEYFTTRQGYVSYLNTGDSYATTICFEDWSGRFRLRCLADYA